MFYKTIFGVLLMGYCIVHKAEAVCSIQGDRGENQDLLKSVLMQSQNCLKNIVELRDQLIMLDTQIKTAFVTNRGIYHPRTTSFSLLQMDDEGLAALLNLMPASVSS